MLAEYLRRYCGIIAEYAEFLRLSSGALFLYLPLHRLSVQDTSRWGSFPSVWWCLWFIRFYLRSSWPFSSSLQPGPFLDSSNSGEKIFLSPWHATNMCTCWLFYRSCVSPLPSFSASKFPIFMSTEIPQKVAAKKGSFKLSKSSSSILCESTEKPLRVQRYNKKMTCARKCPIFLSKRTKREPDDSRIKRRKLPKNLTYASIDNFFVNLFGTSNFL